MVVCLPVTASVMGVVIHNIPELLLIAGSDPVLPDFTDTVFWVFDVHPAMSIIAKQQSMGRISSREICMDIHLLLVCNILIETMIFDLVQRDPESGFNLLI